MAKSSALHAMISFIIFTINLIESNFPVHVLFNLLNLLLKFFFAKLGKKFNNKHSCKIVYLAVPFVSKVYIFHSSSGPDCVQGDKVSIDSLMNLSHI